MSKYGMIIEGLTQIHEASNVTKELLHKLTGNELEWLRGSSVRDIENANFVKLDISQLPKKKFLTGYSVIVFITTKGAFMYYSWTKDLHDMNDKLCRSTELDLEELSQITTDAYGMTSKDLSANMKSRKQIRTDRFVEKYM